MATSHKYPSLTRLNFLNHEEKQWYESIVRNSLSALYLTLTFAEHVDSQQANTTFDSFIQMLSSRWRYRENIGFIIAEEMALSGLSNFRVLRHLHGVMISNAPLSAEGLEERWSWAVGNARVEPYDFSKNGIGYILKKRDDEHCDWRISDNLYLFLPDYQPKSRNERQTLERHLKRRLARQARSAHA